VFLHVSNDLCGFKFALISITRSSNPFSSHHGNMCFNIFLLFQSFPLSFPSNPKTTMQAHCSSTRQNFLHDNVSCVCEFWPCSCSY
jgi:hypothetical protein